MPAMNKKIALQKDVRATGAGGRVTVTHDTIAEPFASMATKAHAPVSRGDKLEFPTTVVFVTRYSLAYLDATRIVQSGRVYKVLSRHNVDDRDRTIVFRCQELVTNGP